MQSEGNTRKLYEEGDLPVNKVVEEKVVEEDLEMDFSDIEEGGDE